MEVDVAEEGTDPEAERRGVLDAITLRLPDTEVVLVFDTELLPETVAVPPRLRVAARDPLEVTEAVGVLEAALEAVSLTVALGVLEIGAERVFVGEAVDVLLSFELIVMLILTVNSGDCDLGPERLPEMV